MKRSAIILGVIGAFGLACIAEATPVGPKPLTPAAATTVPDNGATIMLLGCSLTGLAAIRRWLMR